MQAGNEDLPTGVAVAAAAILADLLADNRLPTHVCTRVAASVSCADMPSGVDIPRTRQTCESSFLVS